MFFETHCSLIRNIDRVKIVWTNFDLDLPIYMRMINDCVAFNRQEMISFLWSHVLNVNVFLLILLLFSSPKTEVYNSDGVRRLHITNLVRYSTNYLVLVLTSHTKA